MQTLLSAQPTDLTSPMKLELGGILSAGLIDLPAEKQRSALATDWDLIGSPSLLPTLQQLARKPLNNPGSNNSDIYAARELKAIVVTVF